MKQDAGTHSATSSDSLEQCSETVLGRDAALLSRAKKEVRQ